MAWTTRWGGPLEFVEGCDLVEFEAYYGKAVGELGDIERRYIEDDPSHLIVWREGSEILGHALWHESNTEEHRKGDPRDDQDRELLRTLAGGQKSFVELHELWLRKEHRGKRYGKLFFDFFEDFIAKKGHNAIVYYAYDPAALAICRKRGYREAYGVESGGAVCWVLYLTLRK